MGWGLFQKLWNQRRAWIAWGLIVTLLSPPAVAIEFTGLESGFNLNSAAGSRFGMAGVVPSFYQCAGGNIATVLGASGLQKDLGPEDDEEEDEDDDFLGRAKIGFQAGFGTPCPEIGDFDKKLSCEEVVVGGQLNPGRVKEARTRARQAYNAMNCKQRRLTAVENELNSCIKPQINAITQAMQGLEMGYQAEIEKSQKQIAKLKGWESDRVAQEEELKGLLEGTSTSPGLLKAKSAHLQMMDQLAQDKLLLKEKWAGVRTERNKLKEFRSIREASLMGECFNTRVVSAEHKCSPGEAAVSPREVLKCRYQQNARIGENGQISEDAVSKQQARTDAAGLDQLILKIFGDLPDKGRLPTSANPQEGADFVNQSINVLSPDEVDRKYGGQLKGMSRNGIDVYAFVMANMRACYARGQSLVLREMSRDNTQLGQLRLGVQRVERDNQTSVERSLTKYQDHYGDVVRALKINGGLGVDACRVQKEEVQNGCFEDIKAKFDELMFSKPIPPIQIRSGRVPRRQDTQTPLEPTDLEAVTQTPGGAISCTGEFAGLAKCIRKVEGIREIVQRDITTLKQKKQETITNTNTAMKKSFQQIASRFSVLTRQATDTMEKMKAALGSLGVKGVRVGDSKMPVANLAPNEDGLLEVPDGANVMQVVNSFMDPKMPDLNGGMFDGIIDQVGSENKSLANQKREAFAAYRRIKEEALSCQKTKIDGVVAKAERGLAEFNAKCSYVQEACIPPEDAYAQLTRSMREIDKSEGGLADDSIATLDSGIRGLCQGSGGLAAEKEEVEGKIAALTKKIEVTPKGLKDEELELFKRDIADLTVAQSRLAEIKKQTGQTPPKSCVAILNGINSNVKTLKSADKAARSLAGEAE